MKDIFFYGQILVGRSIPSISKLKLNFNLCELKNYILLAGSEGAVFGHSVETPLIQARASEDLK